MAQYQEQLLSFGHGGRYFTLEFNKSSDVWNMNQFLACVHVIYKRNYSKVFMKPILEEEIFCVRHYFKLVSLREMLQDRAAGVCEARWGISMQIEVRPKYQFTNWLFQSNNWWSTACLIWIQCWRQHVTFLIESNQATDYIYHIHSTLYQSKQTYKKPRT